ncbi:MAG: hypothetical protein LC745_07170 [Planctomycetia bacterium]|nr:hypothetical protein [Planctomycetia bacterium]
MPWVLGLASAKPASAVPPPGLGTRPSDAAAGMRGMMEGLSGMTRMTSNPYELRGELIGQSLRIQAAQQQAQNLYAQEAYYQQLAEQQAYAQHQEARELLARQLAAERLTRAADSESRATARRGAARGNPLPRYEGPGVKLRNPPGYTMSVSYTADGQDYVRRGKARVFRGCDPRPATRRSSRKQSERRWR